MLLVALVMLTTASSLSILDIFENSRKFYPWGSSSPTLDNNIDSTHNNRLAPLYKEREDYQEKHNGKVFQQIPTAKIDDSKFEVHKPNSRDNLELKETVQNTFEEERISDHYEEELLNYENYEELLAKLEEYPVNNYQIPTEDIKANVVSSEEKSNPINSVVSVKSVETSTASKTELPMVTGVAHQPVNISYSVLENSFLNLFRGGGWNLIKSRILIVLERFLLSNEENIATRFITVDGVRKVLELSEMFYSLLSFAHKVNPKVTEYLADFLEPIWIVISPFEEFNSTSTSTSFLKALRGLANIGAHILVKQARQQVKQYLSVEDLRNFMKNVEMTDPIAALGFDYLLELTTEEERKDQGTGRAYSIASAYDSIERDDHYGGGYGHDDYGHGGGYGHSGGYGHMYPSYHQMDPYLLLAGLGAATLLAYVAYRILVTTTTTAAGRSLKYDFQEEEEADVSLIQSIINKIEQAEDLYDMMSFRGK